jgi:hypothetical protein
MKRHALLALLRLVLTVPIAYAMPMAHFWWGQDYPGDGQQGFGFIVIFAGIGIIAAFLFLFVGTLLQILFRWRAPRLTVLTDITLFVLFAGFLVYLGIAVEYVDRAA